MTGKSLKDRIFDFINATPEKKVEIRILWKNFLDAVDFQNIDQCLKDLISEGKIVRILPKQVWEAGKTQYQVI